jgi:hypothetical protein
MRDNIRIMIGIILCVAIFFLAGFDFGFKHGKSIGFQSGVKMGKSIEKMRSHAEEMLFWQLMNEARDAKEFIAR